MQVQTNSSWPVVSPGTNYLSQLLHKVLFVCFPMDIIDKNCTAHPRKENKYLQVNKGTVVGEKLIVPDTSMHAAEAVK